MREFCGEICYATDSGNVHSDICKHSEGELTEEYRRFLHNCLDEWLRQSNGSGAFWVGDPQYFMSWERDGDEDK